MRTEAREVLAVTPTTVPRSRVLLFAAIAFAGVMIDLASKAYVFRTIGYPGASEWHWEIRPLIWFQLQTSLNHGALWGMGQGWSLLFAGLSVVAVIAILVVLFGLGHARSRWLTVALAFVMAGALGNLYDRLALHGITNAAGRLEYAVRDFLHFRFLETLDWAIFNLADSFLVTGAIMLAIQSFRSETTLVPGVSTTPAATAGPPATTAFEPLPPTGSASTPRP